MIKGLNHMTLAVSNIEESFAFYQDTLGFRPLCKWSKGAYFLVGELWFCLIEDRNRQNDPNPCYTHYAFSIPQEDFPALKEKLIQLNVSCWKENKSEGESFYFLDPSGHKLELHVGDWCSRLAHLKENPKEAMLFLV